MPRRLAHTHSLSTFDLYHSHSQNHTLVFKLAVASVAPNRRTPTHTDCCSIKSTHKHPMLHTHTFQTHLTWEEAVRPSVLLPLQQLKCKILQDLTSSSSTKQINLFCCFFLPQKILKTQRQQQHESLKTRCTPRGEFVFQLLSTHPWRPSRPSDRVAECLANLLIRPTVSTHQI